MIFRSLSPLWNPFWIYVQRSSTQTPGRIEKVDTLIRDPCTSEGCLLYRNPRDVVWVSLGTPELFDAAPRSIAEALWGGKSKVLDSGVHTVDGQNPA